MNRYQIRTQEYSGEIALNTAQDIVFNEYGEGDYTIELLGYSNDKESDIYSFLIGERMWQEPINLVITLAANDGDCSIEFFPMRTSDINN